MAVVTARDSWTVVNQEINMKKGPLIRVELQPGRFVKMYEADAVAAGHIAAPETKAKPKPQDKQIRPQEDKTPKEPEKAKAEVDDFTVIDGVGPATARALVANGVTTFDQLRDAGSLDFLNAAANVVIEAWRGDGG